MPEMDNNICMGCMNPLNGKDICPYCGQSKDFEQESPLLPLNTILSERYIVGKNIDSNGESFNYIGYDKVKKSTVYIKEFFAPNMCYRDEDGVNIRPNGEDIKGFLIQKEKFLKYFRDIARLRGVNSILSLYDIFLENDTAYAIFEWIEGISLEDYIKEKKKPLSWNEARILFMPLISSLIQMHSSGVKHLGICPKNIIIIPSGKIKLIDFGSEDLRCANSPIEYRIYDGCSALEQYNNAYKVDESTDIYGLTASLFFALSGEYPSSALKREKNDKLLMPQNVVKSIPSNVISAIAGGLRVYPNNRTLSFERLRAELSDSPVIHAENRINTGKKQNKLKNKKSNFVWGIWSCIIALSVLCICLIVYWFGWKQNKYDANSLSEQEQSETESTEEELSSRQKIHVPNLIGRNFKTLQNEIKEGENYRVVLLSEEFSDEIGEGCIITQTPEYGKEMDIGGTIAVNISKGSKMKELPNISGKTLAEASLLLTELDLIPKEIRERSSTVKEGNVIDYKDHNPGDKVEYNSEITIRVSKGQN